MASLLLAALDEVSERRMSVERAKWERTRLVAHQRGVNLVTLKGVCDARWARIHEIQAQLALTLAERRPGLLVV